MSHASKAIGTEEPLLKSAPSPEKIIEDIERDGYAIYPDVLNQEIYPILRAHWLDFFTKDKPDHEFVRGDLIFGEKNFNSYSNTKSLNIYRHYDFLWNPPEHALTRRIAIELNRLRNRAQGFHPEKGVLLDGDLYGVYISTSYYPPNEGELFYHSDGHAGAPILHFMIPLTFKGSDYSEGGLYCVDTKGKKIDVDAAMTPGCVLFFDGRIRHGVEKIISRSPQSLGRLAFFAIPTYFIADTAMAIWKRNFRAKTLGLRQAVKDVLALGKTEKKTPY